MIVYVHMVTKTDYLMLLLQLNIIVLLFAIIMTVEIPCYVSLIEYSFIDIASINTRQHICAPNVKLLTLLV